MTNLDTVLVLQGSTPKNCLCRVCGDTDREDFSPEHAGTLCDGCADELTECWMCDATVHPAEAVDGEHPFEGEHFCTAECQTRALISYDEDCAHERSFGPARFV